MKIATPQQLIAWAAMRLRRATLLLAKAPEDRDALLLIVATCREAADMIAISASLTNDEVNEYVARLKKELA